MIMELSALAGSTDGTDSTPTEDDTPDAESGTLKACAHEIFKPGDMRHTLSTALNKTPEHKGATGPPPTKKGLKVDKSVTLDGHTHELKEDVASNRQAKHARWATPEETG